MLTIGDFSRITHLSKKTLRHYHEAGLLEPASVSALNGYRYYTPEQIPVAQLIRRFRELDLPVASVRSLLAASPAEQQSLLAAHLSALESRLAATQEAVTSLRRLLSPVVLDVSVVDVPALQAAAIAEIVDRAGILSWYSSAMDELLSLDLSVSGPPGGLYDDELFAEDRGRMLVYMPCSTAPSVGRVFPFEVPAARVAQTVHVGSHADIDVTYGALGAWILEQGLAASGPVREVYAVGPRDTADESAWRTEIGWSVGAE